MHLHVHRLLRHLLALRLHRHLRTHRRVHRHLHVHRFLRHSCNIRYHVQFRLCSLPLGGIWFRPFLSWLPRAAIHLRCLRLGLSSLLLGLMLLKCQGKCQSPSLTCLLGLPTWLGRTNFDQTWPSHRSSPRLDTTLFFRGLASDLSFRKRMKYLLLTSLLRTLLRLNIHWA